MKMSTSIGMRLMAICFVIGTQVDEAKAQVGLTPENRPAFSPYLNLLRSGGSANLNYFGLVQPQLDFMNAAGSLQGQVTNNQQLASQGASSLQTGHSVVFMNLGGYFQTIRSGQGGGNNVGNQGTTTFGNAGVFGGNNAFGNAGAFGGNNAFGNAAAQFAPQAPLR